jgi:hypothetical protein
MAMKNVVEFIKWNFQDMEAWKYRYIAYMTWILGFGVFGPEPAVGMFGLIAMFTDMFVCIMHDNYKRFKREQDQA